MLRLRGARARALVIAVLVVLVATAVPALAGRLGPAGPTDGFTPSTNEPPEGFTERDYPRFDGRALREQGESERGRRDRERERLRGQEAREERKRSRTAYKQLSREEALGVLRRKHSGLVERPNHPLEQIGPIGEFLNDYTARVDATNGRGRQLVFSTLPLQAQNEHGEKAPVDLSLTERSGAYHPGNPLVDFALPLRLSDGIALGANGIKLHVDRPLLEAPAQVALPPATVVEDKVFYADGAGTDSDFFVTPIPTGIEAFWQLRSADSPNSHRLRFDLPLGASLRSTDDGGADVTRDGTVLMAIRPPTAVDAQGQSVPVSLAVDGSSIELAVSHREADPAYPILVDPVIEDWATDGSGNYNNSWYWGRNADLGNRPDMDGWFYLDSPTDYFPDSTRGNTGIPGGYHGVSPYFGLYSYAYPESATSRYPANSYGEWLWQKPRTTAGNVSSAWIDRVEFGWSYLSYHGGPNNAELWEGIYSSSQSNYTALRRAFAPIDYDYTVVRAGDNCRIPDGYCFGSMTTPRQYGDLAVFALVMPPIGQVRSQWTHSYAGGAIIFLEDAENPTNGTPMHEGLPSGWTKSATPAVTARASDPGLGVKVFTLFTPNKQGGTSTQSAGFCKGTRFSRCTESASHRFTYNTSTMPDGVNTVSYVAADALDKQSDARAWQVRVDTSAPDLTVSGSLHDRRNQASDHRQEGLYDATYTLRAAATDAHSGIKNITISVDGQVREAYAPACDAQTGCPTGPPGLDWTFRADDYADGDHTITVTATDAVGNAAPPQVWTVTVDRRGDIYRAGEYAEIASGDPPIETETEWGRIGTHQARAEEDDFVVTRDRVESDGRVFDEVRTLSTLSGDRDPDTGEQYPDTEEAFVVQQGESEIDPKLDVVADILAPARDFDGETPTETGSILSVTDPWVNLPPDHGNTYELYLTEVEFDEDHTHGDDPDGDTSELGSTRTWVDAKTKMPLRQVVYNQSGVPLYGRVWSYARGRLEVAEVPADFFRVNPASSPGMRKDAQANGNRPMGTRRDAETGAVFEPYFLGNAPFFAGSDLLLAGSDTIVQTVSAATAALSGELDLQSGDQPDSGQGAPSTTVLAYYQERPPDVTTYVPNNPIDDPVLTLRTMASGSSEAAAWRNLYRAQAEAFQADPAGDPSARGGVVIFPRGLALITAYVIPLDEERTSVLMDIGNSTVIVDGEFKKLDVPVLGAQLEVL